MLQNVSKYFINIVIVLIAFFFVEKEPVIAWILTGIASFLFFFLYSQKAIILYSLYFAFEEIILLHAPPQSLLLLKYLGDILILAMFFVTFAKLAMRRYHLKALENNTMHIPLLLFLTCAIISAILNQVPVFIVFISLRQLLRYTVLFYAILFTSESEWTPRDLKLLVKIIIALVLLQAVLGYLQIFFGGPNSELNRFLLIGNKLILEGVPVTISWQGFLSSSRVFGAMISPNTFGLFLVYGFCLLLGIYLSPTDRPKNFRILLLALFLLIPLLKTYSRQSIYAALLGTAVIGWLKKDTKILFFLIAIFASLSLYLYQIRGFKEWEPSRLTLAQRIVSPFHTKYIKLYTQSDRIYSVQTYLPKILNSPYILFGVGPGAFGSPFGFFKKYLEGYKKLGVPPELIGLVHLGAADVGFLSMLGQFGILGFLAFYSILFILFRIILYKELPFITDPFYKGVSVGFLGYVVGLAVSNFGYSNFTIRQISFYFWILAAIICSVRQKQNDTSTTTPFRDSSRPGSV